MAIMSAREERISLDAMEYIVPEPGKSDDIFFSDSVWELLLMG